ncbi:hypothetical protein ACWQOK_000608 [Acinetobacter baumannii]|nr:hypothetical protein [Acinetobacter baumannii]EKW0725303.1 hypothetical protein [Acinetobacter baumannii]EKW6644601.1 hypothetical protein [Acinetobacter baumannii]
MPDIMGAIYFWLAIIVIFVFSLGLFVGWIIWGWIMTNTFSLTAFLISVFINLLIPVLLVRFWHLKKSAFFSCLTWFLMFAVVGEYFRLQENHIRDLADIWFLFAISYMTIFEFGDWIDYEQAQR